MVFIIHSSKLQYQQMSSEQQMPHEDSQEYDEHHALKREEILSVQQQADKNKKKWYIWQDSISSIQSYVQNRNCIKCVMFLVVFLFIITLYQEKAYIIKKQRTFQFFIEKIHKDRSIQDTLRQSKIASDTKQQDQIIRKSVLINQDRQKSHYIQKDMNQNDELTSQISKPIQKYMDHKQNKQSTDGNPVLQTYPKSDEGISQQQYQQSLAWTQIVKHHIKRPSEYSIQQEEYYEDKYNITSYQQYPFCIILLAENFNQNSIQSIVMQNYKNYHIVVIDDSYDKEDGSQISRYLKSQDKIGPQNYTVIGTTKGKGKLYHLKIAAQQCSSEEIMIVVDGYDQLLGRQVLNLYNAVYNQTGAWFVYSSSLTKHGTIGKSRPIPSEIIQNNSFRQYPIVSGQLRSFYTFIFNNIKQQSFINDSNYIGNSYDAALCLPLLQMSHNRVFYIPQITYIETSEIKNDKQQFSREQKQIALIRNTKQYSILKIQGQLYENINKEDGLLQKAMNLPWFNQALQVQQRTEVMNFRRLI